MSPSQDRARGALVGLALGDALGMPISGLSHIHVRTYYKGIKGLRADEKRRDLEAGQWTVHTQRARALAGALAASPGNPEDAREAFEARLARTRLRRASSLPRPSSDPAAAAAPLGVWAAQTDASGADVREAVRLLLAGVDDRPEALVGAVAQAEAVHAALHADAPGDAWPGLLDTAAEAAREAERAWGASARVSDRLADVRRHLDEFPLDLQDRCDGSGGGATEAFPFALAMTARGPSLVEATLLSAINVGGSASAIGAVAGSLLGAMHGASAFPAEWLDGLEDRESLAAEADAMAATF